MFRAAVLCASVAVAVAAWFGGGALMPSTAHADSPGAGKPASLLGGLSPALPPMAPLGPVLPASPVATASGGGSGPAPAANQPLAALAPIVAAVTPPREPATTQAASAPAVPSPLSPIAPLVTTTTGVLAPATVPIAGAIGQGLEPLAPAVAEIAAVTETVVASPVGAPLAGTVAAVTAIVETVAEPLVAPIVSPLVESLAPAVAPLEPILTPLRPPVAQPPGAQEASGTPAITAGSGTASAPAAPLAQAERPTGGSASWPAAPAAQVLAPAPYASSAVSLPLPDATAAGTGSVDAREVVVDDRVAPAAARGLRATLAGQPGWKPFKNSATPDSLPSSAGQPEVGLPGPAASSHPNLAASDGLNSFSSSVSLFAAIAALLALVIAPAASRPADDRRLVPPSWSFAPEVPPA